MSSLAVSPRRVRSFLYYTQDRMGFIPHFTGYSHHSFPKKISFTQLFFVTLLFFLVPAEVEGAPAALSSLEVPKLRRSESRAFLSEDGLPQQIEYFLASDPSAVVEHTKTVLYLLDDDIANIREGELRIHRLRRDDGISSIRSIQTLEIELAEIMKGSFDHFMQKEIYEQPE